MQDAKKVNMQKSIKLMKKINKIFLTGAFLIISLALFSQNLEYKDGHYYKKGMLYTGVHTEYYENGKPKIERHIVNGVEDGEVVVYFKNGRKQELRAYKEGQKDGTWITWNADGVKTAIANYQNNKKDGDWYVWNDEGVLLYEMHYKKGEKTGEWRMYNANGELVNKRKY